MNSNCPQLNAFPSVRIGAPVRFEGRVLYGKTIGVEDAECVFVDEADPKEARPSAVCDVGELLKGQMLLENMKVGKLRPGGIVKVPGPSGS